MGGSGGGGGVGVDIVAGAVVNEGVIFGGSGGAGGSGSNSRATVRTAVAALVRGCKAGATLTDDGLDRGRDKRRRWHCRCGLFRQRRVAADPGSGRRLRRRRGRHTVYSDVLELASAGSAGTLSGLGTQFSAFATVAVDNAAVWTLTGANTIAAGDTLADSGRLTTSGSLSAYGTLAVYGALTNSGTITGAAGSAGTYTSGSNFGTGGGGGAGGTAVTISAGSLTNNSVISGGLGVAAAVPMVSSRPEAAAAAEASASTWFPVA